jgi:hypothetical protein
MAIKYQCCHCEQIFPADEAIDGFAQGYRVGFLCPRCGRNIQAGLSARQKLSVEQYAWAIVAFILFVPIVLSRFSDMTFTFFTLTFSLETLSLTVWLLFMLVLFVLKPALFKATTFVTEPVDKT